ncbi:hypothetical protein ES695_04010 [Candidatus Atribacteria bacterium 1244-E10-H5-B2]|nr:MAG: hypothetical protein ES695_04010 [Candidatus Atribacteria bacterium 1244-E10-H5-B2]
MKKLLIILMVVAMAFLFVGCLGTTPPVDPDEPDPDEPGLYFTGIEVNPKTMDLIVRETKAIKSVTATYEVRAYEDSILLTDCLFLTDDKTIATVDSDGVVTAESVGIASILVKYEGKFDTIAVTVTKPKSMEIIADMPLFTVNEVRGFEIKTVAYDDVGKNVLAYFTTTGPAGAVVSLWYWEDVNSEAPIIISLPTEEESPFGSNQGFLLEDVITKLKATFSKAGTYTTTFVFKTVSGEVTLCTKVITAEVVKAPE